jgi:hypothetical protein
VGLEELGLAVVVGVSDIFSMKTWTSSGSAYVLPLLPPPPSQYEAPLPLRLDPEAPTTLMPVPLTAKRGPSHSYYYKCQCMSSMCSVS